MDKLSSYSEQIKKTIKEISVQEAFTKAESEEGILIDIRDQSEARSGVPQSSILIPRSFLEMQIEARVGDNDQEVMVICASGKRSLLAAHVLKNMGINNVSSVAGGFNSWKDAGLPIKTVKFLDDNSRERYGRHLLIPEVGEQGQLKLLDSKVLLVGAGGLGSPTALYLAAAGVGTLGIIDHDVVDLSNLQRQILHSEDFIGKPKTDSAIHRLKSLNSEINIIGINKQLTAENVEEIFSEYDVIVDGTDNFTTRYLVNDACVKLNKPNVHGAIFRFDGYVSVFWPQHSEQAPCYRCLYSEPPPPELAPSCAEAGVLGILPGTIGTFVATEVIKIILEIGEPLIGKMLSYNALDMSFSTYDVKPDHNCSVCAQSPESIQYKTYDKFCSLT